MGSAIEQTRRHYGRYLSLRPDDLATRIQYAKFMFDLPDYAAAFFQNDKILRTDLTDADDALRKKVEEVRDRQIQLAIRLQRLSDALYHIDIQKTIRKDDPKLIELRGYCQLDSGDSQENRDNAQKDFEEAIRLAPQQVSTYSLLAMLQRDRMKQPALAEATIAKMLEANPESAEAYLVRARFRMNDKDPAKQLEQTQKEIIQQATADCDKALQLDSKNIEALYVRSQCIEASAPYEPDAQVRVALYRQVGELVQQLIDANPSSVNAPQLYLRLSILKLKMARDASSDGSSERPAIAAAIDVLREGVKNLENVTREIPARTFDLRFRLAELLVGYRPQDDVAQQTARDTEFEGILAELKAEARKLTVRDVPERTQGDCQPELA